MISFLLFKAIVQLFLMMLLGFVTVKAGILKSDDSVVLSKVNLYVVMPCVIINAFQIDYTPEIAGGLMLGFAVAFIIHILLIGADILFGKKLRLNEVETASIIYSNAANLVIPIVQSVLGQEWVVYTSPFVSVQLVFIWTHCKSLFAGEKRMDWRKIAGNINMIAIFAGILMLILRVKLPDTINRTMSSVGSMIGPLGMIITGMVMAKMDFKKLLSNRRVYMASICRMLVCPAAVLVLLAASGAGSMIPNGSDVLLITFLAVCTPAATTVTQFAQLHKKDAAYAGAINIVTTLMSIVTMPVFVALYQMVMR